jgi:hypothetical protein
METPQRGCAAGQLDHPHRRRRLGAGALGGGKASASVFAICSARLAGCDV